MRFVLLGAGFTLIVGGYQQPQVKELSAAVPDQPGAMAEQDRRAFSESDRAKVEARIADLNRSMMSGNPAGAMDVVPPRLFQEIARRAGATESELRAALKDTIATQMQGITVVSYEMNLAGAPPTRTPDGTRTYLLIPTTNIMQVEGTGRIRATTSTLALEDEGEWYLVRVDDANQISLIREIWPEFAQVDFPAGKTEPI